MALNWTGPAVANPFTLAMSRIQSRQAPAIAAAPAEQEPINVVQKTGPSLLNGQVTDLATGNPIAGAVVSVSGSGEFETKTGGNGALPVN